MPAQYGGWPIPRRSRRARLELARRSGIKLEADEEPPPVDFGDGDVRQAVRELYVARFGDAELDKQKSAAESAVPAGAAASGTKINRPRTRCRCWRRLGQVIQGEPQVPDAGAFYQALLQRAWWRRSRCPAMPWPPWAPVAPMRS